MKRNDSPAIFIKMTCFTCVSTTILPIFQKGSLAHALNLHFNETFIVVSVFFFQNGILE